MDYLVDLPSDQKVECSPRISDAKTCIAWERPIKVMNHRSQKRIVDLCNDIRRDVDGIQQQSRNNKQDGTECISKDMTSLNQMILLSIFLC